MKGEWAVQGAGRGGGQHLDLRPRGEEGTHPSGEQVDHSEAHLGGPEGEGGG